MKADRTAWLIEITAGPMAPAWLCGPDAGGWTKDANSAMSFPTKEVAQDVFERLKTKPHWKALGFGRTCYAITEHMFVGEAQPATQPLNMWGSKAQPEVAAEIMAQLAPAGEPVGYISHHNCTGPYAIQFSKTMQEIYFDNCTEYYPVYRTPQPPVNQQMTTEAQPQAEPIGWQHLKSFGYAPGDYIGRCHTCNEIVSDIDKLAITCRPCAETHKQKKDAARYQWLRANFVRVTVAPDQLFWQCLATADATDINKGLDDAIDIAIEAAHGIGGQA